MVLSPTRPAVLVGLAAAALYLAAYQAGWGWVALAAKPVPVLCLAWLAWTGMPPAAGRRAWLIAGLLLSALGDVILALPGALSAALDPAGRASLAGWSFMAGLGAFLLAHLCYIAWFLSLDRTVRPVRAVAPVVYGAVLLAILWPHLGAMLVPVAAYAVVITVMLWRALAAAQPGGAAVLRHPAAWGALLFVLSDSLIAINRFIEPLPLAAFAIILTYWAGQCGIFLSSARNRL